MRGTDPTIEPFLRDLHDESDNDLYHCLYFSQKKDMVHINTNI